MTYNETALWLMFAGMVILTYFGKPAWYAILVCAVMYLVLK